jgi:hypothetical protein
MKFVLIVSVCSFIESSCKEPLQHPIIFDTWKECSIAAIETSTKFLELQSTEDVNKYRLATKYTCEETGII